MGFILKLPSLLGPFKGLRVQGLGLMDVLGLSTEIPRCLLGNAPSLGTSNTGYPQIWINVRAAFLLFGVWDSFYLGKKDPFLPRVMWTKKSGKLACFPGNAQAFHALHAGTTSFFGRLVTRFPDPLKDPKNRTSLCSPRFPTVLMGSLFGGTIFWIL